MNKVNESVLVVEDDAALREALLDTLRAVGMSALAAPDAPAALQLLASEEIALVISDVQMPGSSGLDLLDHIVADRQSRFIVVACHTNDGNHLGEGLSPLYGLL